MAVILETRSKTSARLTALGISEEAPVFQAHVVRIVATDMYSVYRGEPADNTDIKDVKGIEVEIFQSGRIGIKSTW